MPSRNAAPNSASHRQQRPSCQPRHWVAHARSLQLRLCALSLTQSQRQLTEALRPSVARSSCRRDINGQKAQDRHHPRAARLPLADRRSATSRFLLLRRAPSARPALLQRSLAFGLSAGKAASTTGTCHCGPPSGLSPRTSLTKASGCPGEGWVQGWASDVRNKMLLASRASSR